MGLTVRAFSHMELTPEHARGRECTGWTTPTAMPTHPHIPAFVLDGFDQSLRGLVDGRCYAQTARTVSVCVLSMGYAMYAGWRSALSVAGLGVTPGVVWDHPDDFRGDPFFELIHFADNEGTIGPEAAADLLADFEAAPDLAGRLAASVHDKPLPLRVREQFGAVVGQWVTGLTLAADGGLVRFA